MESQISYLNYVIGVDIGTTSTKAVLFSDTGKPIVAHAIGYPLYTPSPAVAEQDPEAIWQAVTQSVRHLIEASRIDPTKILCLSFSSAMHSLIAVDIDGKPLTRSITWADNRSAKWASHIKQHDVGQTIYHRTGTPIHAMSPLVKLVWLRNDHPEIFTQTAKFISIKEFVFYRFFGKYLIDYSIASATGLFNLRQLNWDQAALEMAGITEQHLSQLVPTTHIERINSASAEVMGLVANTAIVMGASDGVLANLSVGAIAPGRVAVTVGTSGAVRAVVDQPWTDPQGRLFCYALTENHWAIGGAVNSGGVILRWVHDQLSETMAAQAHKDPYELLMELAESSDAGCEGLIFHPYLSGERAPLWDANASGSFVGLTLRHTKAHLIRAVLEGIAFNLNLVLQALQERIGAIEHIQASGGLAKSHLWRQMMADVFAQEIWVSESYGSSCLGAAVLGLYALQKIPSLDAVNQMLGKAEQHSPNPRNVAIYQKVFPIYVRLLHSLQAEYADLAELRSELGK